MVSRKDWISTGACRLRCRDEHEMVIGQAFFFGLVESEHNLCHVNVTYALLRSRLHRQDDQEGSCPPPAN